MIRTARCNPMGAQEQYYIDVRGAMPHCSEPLGAPAEGLLFFRLLQNALERPAELDKSDVQAREQPADRVQRRRVQPPLQAGQMRPVDAHTQRQPFLGDSNLTAQRANGLRKSAPDLRAHRWFGITASLSPIHSILPRSADLKAEIVTERQDRN